jgi:hypothetical protein
VLPSVIAHMLFPYPHFPPHSVFSSIFSPAFPRKLDLACVQKCKKAAQKKWVCFISVERSTINLPLVAPFQVVSTHLKHTQKKWSAYCE